MKFKNAHAQVCKNWNDEYTITVKTFKAIPRVFEFNIVGKNGIGVFDCKHCAFCGAELIHYIEQL